MSEEIKSPEQLRVAYCMEAIRFEFDNSQMPYRLYLIQKAKLMQLPFNFVLQLEKDINYDNM